MCLSVELAFLYRLYIRPAESRSSIPDQGAAQASMLNDIHSGYAHMPSVPAPRAS